MRGRALAHAAMLAFAFLVSTSFTVGAVIARDIDPLALTFLRFLLAALLFTAVVAALGGLARPRFADLVSALVFGGLVGTYFVTMFMALELTGALATGALFALVPLMTAAIAWPLLGQRLNARELAGLGLAAGGALWVVFDGSFERMRGLHLGPGEAIYLLGCLAYAAYSPAIRLLDRGDSALAVSFWTVLAGLALVGLYAMGTILETDWARLPVRVYVAVAYLAVFTTVVSFFLIQYASTRLAQAKVMAYTYLIPAFIVATDWVAHGRLPSPAALAGVVVIASAMLVLQLSRRLSADAGPRRSASSPSPRRS